LRCKQSMLRFLDFARNDNDNLLTLVRREDRWAKNKIIDFSSRLTLASVVVLAVRRREPKAVLAEKIFFRFA
ncbi:MAG: hypothetical protein K2J75_03115, partial [Clostridia bacterium]|nr:hypothetical protein [Clostridia bacterium]